MQRNSQPRSRSSRPAPKKRNLVPFVVAGVGLLFVAVIAGCSSSEKPSTQPEPEIQEISKEMPGEKAPPPPPRVAKTLAEVEEICKRSVVQVLQGSMQQVGVVGSGQKSEQFVAYSSGTGSIITRSGYVLTNSHVVSGGGQKVLLFYDYGQTKKPYKCRVVGKSDPMDLAILKIEADETFTPVSFGRSGEMKKGDRVFVGGFPSAEGFKVREGALSAANVGWAYPWGYGGSSHPDYLQAIGLIRPGNSGGPMFNQFGEQVGVCCGDNRAVSAGHAIPIDTLVKRMADIFDAEGANGFVLGMTVAGLGPESGVVTKVDKGLPAAAAGVKVGDKITAIDGRSTEEGLDFYLNLLDRKAGDTLQLALSRDGRSEDATITLAKRPMRTAEKVNGLVNGTNIVVYEGRWTELPVFATLQPVQAGHGVGIVQPFPGRDGFALRFTGYIKVPADGAYTLYTASDDGSKLYIGDEVVVNNDGLHGTVGAKGYVSLEAGFHPITVEYMDHGGGDELKVYWEGPGFGMQEIPGSALYRRP